MVHLDVGLSHGGIMVPQKRSFANIGPIFAGRRVKLSPKEVENIFPDVHNPDIRIRNQTIEAIAFANIGLVIRIARSFRGCCIPLEDLVQEGIDVLMREAIPRYNPEIAKFSTYAAHWLLNAFRLIRNTGSLDQPFSVASYYRFAEYNIKTAEKNIIDRSGVNMPTAEAIYDYIQTHGSKDAKRLPLKKIEELLWSRNSHSFSLNQPAFGEGGTTHSEAIPDEGMHTPEKLIEINRDAKIFAEQLRKEINRLSARDKAMITLRFGLNGKKHPTSLSAAGAPFDLTRERVRQIEKKVLTRVAKQFKITPKCAKNALYALGEIDQCAQV